MGSSSEHDTSSPARQPPEFLAVGRVVKPHGVRGGLKVVVLSDLIQSLRESTMVFHGADKLPARIREIRPHQSGFLLFLEGFSNRSEAELLRDQKLYLRYDDVDALTEDTYYHWQIIGLEVYTHEGEELGSVVNVLETGANDVYVIHDESGDELLLPAITSVILEVDLENSMMIVNLLPGMRSGS
jgi:16S rRNA processing protein RimM